MLLAEGMNLKVLLLPDGDDPDSFARKHTATEFKDYIEQHATDFISFKTRLTVENVTDPVKRSEAIGGIVKSISVIPDQILRSTYLSELSQRLGIKEQTLLNSMNSQIRKDIEEKEKERERAQGQDAADGNPQPPSRNYVGLHSVDEQTAEIERLLVQTIIRNGEKVIFEDVETDDGGKVNLTVAQYISYDLGADGLAFHDPLHNQVLDEAVAHSGEEGFEAESYFIHHPDIAISSLATELAIDRHQLGKGFQLKEREGGLRQQVLHLVLDFRYYFLGNREKELLAALKANRENYMETMREYMRIKALYDAVSKKLGRDIK